MRETYMKVFAFLGLFLSIPATISVIQHIWDVGLAAYFAGFLDFYRALFGPIFDWLYTPLQALLRPFSIEIPLWLRDLHVLSLTGGGIFVRASNAAADQRPELRALAQEQEIVRDSFGLAVKTLIVSLFFLGLVVLVLTIIVAPFVLLRMLRQRLRNDPIDGGDWANQATVQILAVAGAVCMFFVLNAATI